MSPIVLALCVTAMVPNVALLEPLSQKSSKHVATRGRGKKMRRWCFRSGEKQKCREKQEKEELAEVLFNRANVVVFDWICTLENSDETTRDKRAASVGVGLGGG